MTRPMLDSSLGTEYARRLRALRERRNMTQKALADAMAYDRSRVAHIEAGRQGPTEDFTRHAEAVLQAGGILWELWEEISKAREGIPARLPERDLRTTEFVAWLADHSGVSFEALYGQVNALIARLEGEPPSVRYGRAHARGLVSRERIASALTAYYGSRPPGAGFYQARVGGTEVLTGVLTRPEWIDTAVELGGGHEAFSYLPPTTDSSPHLDEVQTKAAMQRLATVELTGVVMINNPLYRLLDVSLDAGHLAGTVTTVPFAEHAMTTELMEGELLDALTSGSDELPLRDRYLSTTESVLDLQSRTCVGGAASVLAVARRHPGDRRRDYVLFAQERSKTVINATGKLGVIPKAFHQPTGEPTEEAAISATVRRELEEELLGRQDLEQLAAEGQPHADPLHPHHLTEPMSWLLNQGSDAFRMECTGLGINTVTSNYEFTCLLVINDESWWDRFGHLVAVNWEALRVHRYSTLDTAGIEALVNDPRWGNESMFALVQGLRRLSAIGDPDRLALPPIELDL